MNAKLISFARLLVRILIVARQSPYPLNSTQNHLINSTLPIFNLSTQPLLSPGSKHSLGLRWPGQQTLSKGMVRHTSRNHWRNDSVDCRWKDWELPLWHRSAATRDATDKCGTVILYPQPYEPKQLICILDLPKANLYSQPLLNRAVDLFPR